MQIILKLTWKLCLNPLEILIPLLYPQIAPTIWLFHCQFIKMKSIRFIKFLLRIKFTKQFSGTGFFIQWIFNPFPLEYYKILISSRSPFFKKLYARRSNIPDEITLIVLDSKIIPSHLLPIVLRFIYTNELIVLPDQVKLIYWN